MPQRSSQHQLSEGSAASSQPKSPPPRKVSSSSIIPTNTSHNNTVQYGDGGSNITNNQAPASSSSFQHYQASPKLPPRSMNNKKRKHEFVNYSTVSSGGGGTEKQLHDSAHTSTKALNNKQKVSDKRRMIWTSELHEAFVGAVRQLGANEARPKEILELMNISDHSLTTSHIKSHLQKHRMQLKKEAAVVSKSNHNNQRRSSKSSSNTNNNGRILQFKEVVPQQQQLKKEKLLKHHPETKEGVTSSASTSSAIVNNNNPPSTPTPTPMTIIGQCLNNSSTIPSSFNNNYSQSLASLMNESDQANYIKNILNFNQLGNNLPSYNIPLLQLPPLPPQLPLSLPPMHQNNLHNQQHNLNSGNTNNNNTYANSITNNNNITNVNHFHLDASSLNNDRRTTTQQPQQPLDGKTILKNCHLLTLANLLPEFLVLLQEICNIDQEISAIFKTLPIGFANDLNLVAEGFKIGFVCGMKYPNRNESSFSNNNQINNNKY